jgi:hypothetical protein
LCCVVLQFALGEDSKLASSATATSSSPSHGRSRTHLQLQLQGRASPSSRLIL